MPEEISRRHVLGMGAALGAGIALSGGRAEAAATPARVVPRNAYQPISMVTHLHSSFSEGGSYAGGGGGGSMMAQLDQATLNNVDVIWWTDHDWRMQAFGYYEGIAFDGTDEERDLGWFVQSEGNIADASHAFISEPHSPNESGKAMRVAARGPDPVWGTSLMWAKAGNSFYATNLSDTTLTVDVLGEQISPDAELVVEVSTAYRPATAGRPAGEYRLHYRLGTTAGRILETPLLGVVTTSTTGRWQTLTLPLLEDIKAFWPDLVAEDSSIARLRFGVVARGGATGQGVFDHLRFQRTRDRLSWPVETQRALMTRLGERYPEVTQHLSTEVSMVRHMNVFMEDFELFEYPPQSGPPRLDGSVEASLTMVQWYHDRGALVQYNHPPLDRAELVSTGALGTDLIEVPNAAGDYDTMRERLELFDVAARNAIFLTATSQQDDHIGKSWIGFPHFFLTSVWAVSTGLTDLKAAMAAGQVWCHDLVRWPEGQLDLTVTDRQAMGKVLETRAARQETLVSAVGLPAASTVQVVVGACDLGGPTPSVVRHSYPASAFAGGPLAFVLDRGAGSYLRVEVYDSADRIIGLGNPFWLLPVGAGISVPEARRLRPGHPHTAD